MRIEEKIFQRKTPNYNALAPFGFLREGDVWRYREDFMGGDFYAEITVDGSGRVSGLVYDVMAGEEYLPVHVESRVGAFVGEVREAYAAILEKAAAACFFEEPFLFPQANRIAGLILEKYGELPDYPFATATTFGVFRVRDNAKWYALIMNIPKCKLTGEKVADIAASPLVEVMNVKVGEDGLSDALKVPGVYTCYHMSHKSWASVILDGTVSDEKVIEFIAVSRAFAEKSGKKRGGRAKKVIDKNGG